MNYARLDPGLVRVVEDYEREGRSGLGRHSPRLGLISIEASRRPPRVLVFVDADDDIDLRSAPGMEGGRGVGGIRTGAVPLDSIGLLSDQVGVRRIVAARRLRPHMDVARARVGVPALRDRRGVSGRGVVVGIVDTGVETDHPAFAGRILRLWDQTLPGPGVDEGGYGRELPGDMHQLSVDTVGHGTHVAGIAAGDDPTYEGVAPEAEFVIVKNDLLDAHLADGLRYVFRVAGELGRPAVVALTSGGIGDAHDGTDPLSLIVDASSGPGRIVCCSAGNEGNDNVHASLDLAADGCATIPCALALPSPGGPPVIATFTGWYGAADELAVAVVSPTGAQTPFQPVATKGSPARAYVLPEGEVRVVTPGPDPANGDHAFLVQVSPSAPAPAPVRTTTWGLRLRADHVTAGRIDVWSVDGTVAQLVGKHVRDAVKVGSPAAASAAVTVGSYTTRVEWFNVLGHPHEAGFALEEISDFSSEGPRRDGAEKPDLVAPGAMIGAALSGESPFPLQYLMDDLNLLKAGTSAAAAFVTGLIALLLERDHAMTPEEVKACLRASCRIPGRDPGAFDAKWGYGLIDAERLCDVWTQGAAP